MCHFGVDLEEEVKSCDSCGAQFHEEALEPNKSGDYLCDVCMRGDS